jgi:hypothetical protein
MQQLQAATAARTQAESALQMANVATTQASDAAARSLAVEAQARVAGQTAEAGARQAAEAAKTAERAAHQAAEAAADITALGALQKGRSVPTGKKKEVIEKLAEKKGASVRIQYAHDDGEAENFARELARLFFAAEWDANVWAAEVMPTAGYVTMWVTTPEDEPLALYAMSTLHFVLWNPTIRLRPNQGRGLTITVGKIVIAPKILPD